MASSPINRISTATLSLFTALAMGACGDDEASSTADGTSTAATDSTSDTGSSTAAVTPPEASTSSSSSSGSAETDSSTSTSDDPDSSGTSEGSDSSGGEGASCDEGGQDIGFWLIQVIDGDFPNDLPTDLDESCTVGMGAPGTLRLDCPSVSFALEIPMTPAVTLPAVGTTVDTQLHHEPGWLGWPDLWIQLDYDGSSMFLQQSSQLAPNRGMLSLPWNMSESKEVCGPYEIDSPFGPDPCGAQNWLSVDFEVGGETLSVLSGTHQLLELADASFQAWVGQAREYVALPKTCDISPVTFNVVTLHTAE
ncbi:MAG: hypothetical protein AAF799_27735 [Myxococcota bacterium]